MWRHPVSRWLPFIGPLVERLAVNRPEDYRKRLWLAYNNGQKALACERIMEPLRQLLERETLAQVGDALTYRGEGVTHAAICRLHNHGKGSLDLMQDIAVRWSLECFPSEDELDDAGRRAALVYVRCEVVQAGGETLNQDEYATLRDFFGDNQLRPVWNNQSMLEAAHELIEGALPGQGCLPRAFGPGARLALLALLGRWGEAYLYYADEPRPVIG